MKADGIQNESCPRPAPSHLTVAVVSSLFTIRQGKKGVKDEG